MIALFFWLLLRRLLEKPLRLIAYLLGFMVLVAVPDLLLRRYLDADLPRAATAALLVVLAAAALFLRASWRRRRPRSLTRPEGWVAALGTAAPPPQTAPPSPAAPGKRWFALRIAVLRGPDGSTRTAVVFDRQRRR